MFRGESVLNRPTAELVEKEELSRTLRRHGAVSPNNVPEKKEEKGCASSAWVGSVLPPRQD